MRFLVTYARAGLLIALLFAVVSPLSTYALEQGDNITLSPTDKHYSVSAGEHVSDTFTVINNGTTQYDFKVYAKPYAVKGANYEPTFNEVNQYADGYKWISLPAVVYHLNSGEKASVPFDIFVSKGARTGGHYAALFAQAQGALPNQTGVTSNKSLGMLIYIDVKGSTVTKGVLKSLNLPWYQPVAPLTAVTRVENTGETDFDTTVTFAVTDIAGDVKYQTSRDYTVLPKTEREMKLTWDKSPWFGLYKTRISTTILGKTDTRESYIVIAPRWLVFVAFLAIILGAIDVVRRKRTTTKRKSR